MGWALKTEKIKKNSKSWATFQYTKLNSDTYVLRTYVIAKVNCKIQGFEFLQNIQNCEVINDYVSNDLYYIFIIYKKSTLDTTQVRNTCYLFLTDRLSRVGSFTEKKPQKSMEILLNV